MLSMNDKSLLPAFESIKDDGEQIQWTGKPKFIPFIFSEASTLLAIMGFATVWTLFMKGWSGIAERNAPIGMFPTHLWIVGLFIFIMPLIALIGKILSFPNTVYAYSDRRIMIRTGFIGTSFKVIDYDKISDIEVTVSFVEKMYKMGTIRFFSGRTQNRKNGTVKLYDSWTAIENPYEVFKMVKQTSVNIKTDFNYPNALRPGVNPGYNTKYKPGG